MEGEGTDTEEVEDIQRNRKTTDNNSDRKTRLSLTEKLLTGDTHVLQTQLILADWLI